jgi:tetratricopeptide (TPR) repeat protein
MSRLSLFISLWLALALPVSIACAQQLEIPKDATNQELLDSANSAWSSGNLPVAKQLFEELVRRDPKHPEAWAGIGWMIYYSHGPAEDAEAAFRKQIEIDPFHHSAYLGLYYALSQQGKSAEAEQMLKKQLEIDPLDFESHRALGQFYFGQHRYKEAIAEFDTALRIKPEDTSVKMFLGFAYSNAGDQKKGQEYMRQAQHDAPPQLRVASSARYDAYQEIFAGLPGTEGSAPAAMAELAPVNVDEELAAAQAREQKVAAWLMKAEPGAATERQMAMTTELAVAWARIGAAYLRKADLPNAERYLHASWLLTFAPPVAGQLARIYEQQQKWLEAYEFYQFSRDVLVPYGTELSKHHDEASDRLRKKLTSAQFARAMKMSNFSSDSRTVFLDHLAHNKQQKAEFAVSFVADPHRDAVLEDFTPVNGDAALKRFEAKLKASKFNLEFPDDVPARIIRHEFMFCGLGGCSFTLDMLPQPLSPEQRKMNGID